MQVPDATQDYPEQVRDIVLLGEKFPHPTGLFRIELKPKDHDNGEVLLRRYVDSTGFLCVCENHVIVFMKGSPQAFNLCDIEKITFMEKDALETSGNVQINRE